MGEEDADYRTIVHPKIGARIVTVGNPVHLRDDETLQDDGQGKVHENNNERETIAEEESE